MLWIIQFIGTIKGYVTLMILIHCLPESTTLEEMCHSFVLILFLKKTPRNVLHKNKYYVSVV